MNKYLWTFLILLALPAIAFAQTAAPQATASAAPSLGEMISKSLPMFVVIFLVFHFMVIKPQQTKEKNQAALLKSLKAGDNVKTTGGIHGRVSNVNDTHIQLEIAPGVKVKVDPAHIAKKEG